MTAIVVVAASLEPKRRRRKAQGFSLVICSFPCARWGPWLGLCETLGALARPWRRDFSYDFCNCVRARWRWVSLGRGGRGTSTAAATHVTGCIPVGFGCDPGWGGGGDGGVVGVGCLKRKRWLFESASPPPPSRTAAPPGGKPPRDTPFGVCQLFVEEKVWRPIFSSAFLLAKCTYIM